MLQEYGLFYKAYYEKTLPIYIYGAGLDGISYAIYLLNNNYDLAGFIDKKFASDRELRDIPVFNIEDIPDDECYILLAAKTDVIAEEMGEIARMHLSHATIFGWKAWCINPEKMDGRSYCSIVDFPDTEPWMYCSIYGTDYPTERYKEVYLPPVGPVMKGINGTKECYYCLSEFHSEYWNIDAEGMRESPYNNPSERKIVFVGDSRILGVGVDDAHTIPSQLQKLLDDKGYSYSVKNYSVTMSTLDNTLAWINSIQVSSGDILCFSMGYFQMDEEVFQDIQIYDYTDYYKYRLGQMFDMLRVKGVMVFGLITTPCDARIENTLAEKTYIEIIKIAHRTSRLLRFDKDEIIAWSKTVSGGIYDLDSISERYHLLINFYIDRGHYSPEGNRLMAQEIMNIVFEKEHNILSSTLIEYIDNYLDENRVCRIYPFVRDEKWKEYRKYLLDNKFQQSDCKIGAVVMNANPFTKGHEYLVGYAAENVDWLYVFVLEEDCSEIAFFDRLEMVKEGTEQFDNVCVLKGGSFIISKQTFPEYFDRPDSEVDTTCDLGFFCQLIAPLLNIRYRFVGEEPYSTVTRGYNKQMKEILPKYGIECVEIERFKDDKTIVSATMVRKAIGNNDLSTLKHLLPETSLNYLFSHGIIMNYT